MASDKYKKDKEIVTRPLADGVKPVSIAREMQEAYLDYSMSVIVSRALPDVRDGLKPVHRRILFSMHELGLTAASRFKKSATIVGDVLGKYHPHGDSSVYEAMVKLAQDFAIRYPLVWGQGNFGSIDGDGAAAHRYTEAKMTKIAGELLRDIEKETVDFMPNFDGERKEPVVLPAAVPNILLNGTFGIAVGMATKIPPHNLGEVVDALLHFADNPQSTNEDLLQFVKGPDFPTGGMIFNQKDIHHAYSTGRGGVTVRGEAEIVETKAGQNQIIITSIPYQVNKSEMIIKMADLVREKKVEGIRDIRDESTRDIRVVIDLKTGSQPQKILNALYKHTDLENAFHYNMLALVGGVPKLLSLRSIIEEFFGYRQEVVVRRTKFDLAKAEAREHILLGLKIALDHIDEVIKTIRKSKDTPTAQVALMKEFKLSDLQATAILEMRLQKLAGLERQKVEDELKEKQNFIKECLAILADPKKIIQIVKTEFQQIREKYADPRRTKVVKGGVKEINVEDLIEEKENVLVLTSGGYVKRTDPAEYRAQRRGGSGVMDLNVKEEDFVTIFLTANTHDDLLFFTDKGKVYQLKMYDIPEAKRATRGKSVMNFLSLSAEEKVTSVLAFNKATDHTKLAVLMVTKNGEAKKVKAESFKDVRRTGIIAIKLEASDELLAVFAVEKGDTAIVATREGQSIRFKESDIREMGRAAGGVRAIKLGKSDRVVGADVVQSAKTEVDFLVMGENGYGKKTKLKEYKIQKRGGSGIKTFKVTVKTGKLMSSRVLTEVESEIVAISKHGQIIRTSLDEIPTLGRQTQGVRIMKLKGEDSIASLTCL
ncbi:MAG: DNA gyrase subunit A [Candidatus Vogelbacteria bacterium RIFOXYD1_FULL_44_32]|uniref:DNA gyrase subunit A n=1 Tax=Candidatus Vogelbacteria bacterium RIFOXYD1_FULL_44_32 TaxID=1802438 RepID=A0A1G2QD72_9BACT|nr:MAG: DNA gyrase subunit A [Candidatus Vogelbacteria bacterium RIFOXYD1_FULL_44_32]